MARPLSKSSGVSASRQMRHTFSLLRLPARPSLGLPEGLGSISAPLPPPLLPARSRSAAPLPDAASLAEALSAAPSPPPPPSSSLLGTRWAAPRPEKARRRAEARPAQGRLGSSACSCPGRSAAWLLLLAS